MGDSTKPTPLEGIVLDRDGNTLYEPKAQEIPRARVFRVGYVGAWWPLLLGIAIPLLFVSGIFIFTVVLTLGILIRLLRALLR